MSWNEKMASTVSAFHIPINVLYIIFRLGEPTKMCLFETQTFFQLVIFIRKKNIYKFHTFKIQMKLYIGSQWQSKMEKDK